MTSNPPRATRTVTPPKAAPRADHRGARRRHRDRARGRRLDPALAHSTRSGVRSTSPASGSARSNTTRSGSSSNSTIPSACRRHRDRSGYPPSCLKRDAQSERRPGGPPASSRLHCIAERQTAWQGQATVHRGSRPSALPGPGVRPQYCECGAPQPQRPGDELLPARAGVRARAGVPGRWKLRADGRGGRRSVVALRCQRRASRRPLSVLGGV